MALFESPVAAVLILVLVVLGILFGTGFILGKIEKGRKKDDSVTKESEEESQQNGENSKDVYLQSLSDAFSGGRSLRVRDVYSLPA